MRRSEGTVIGVLGNPYSRFLLERIDDFTNPNCELKKSLRRIISGPLLPFTHIRSPLTRFPTPPFLIPYSLFLIPYSLSRVS